MSGPRTLAFDLPPAEPARIGAFLWGLLLASLASFAAILVLGVLFGVLTAFGEPSELAARSFEVFARVASGVVFLLFLIRRGRYVRSRAAA